LTDAGVPEEMRQAYVAEHIKRPGDEWGRPKDVKQIVEQWIVPYITTETTALELGVGGGRVAAHIANHVAKLYAVDISEHMLHRARESLVSFTNIEYLHSHDARLPAELTDTIDFAYSFDVFVHLDLHMMRAMVEELHRALKPGGRAFLHTSNLSTDAGWRKFHVQSSYRPVDHFFVTPETVNVLLRRTGFRVVKGSEEDPSNFYLARDYLVLVER
jgi:ubiquinone/menaquinone biosynthesis C-methylase UbiE